MATPTTDLTGAVAFGEVTLHESGGVSPDERITVAIKGLGSGGGDITLTATVEQKNGNSRVNLAWSPADGGDVNVLRNGKIKFTTQTMGAPRTTLTAVPEQSPTRCVRRLRRLLNVVEVTGSVMLVLRDNGQSIA